MIKAPSHLSPPHAEEKPITTLRHGVEDIDPFHWLRADNWQEVMRKPDRLDKTIQHYLDAENSYLEAVMAPTRALQKKLFDEMKARIKEDDRSVPEPDGPFEYYYRYRTGGQHPILCRRPRGVADDSAETILLDGDAKAEGHAYFAIGSGDHSYNHMLYAYATDTSGAEFYTIQVQNLETGALLPDTIPDTSGGVVWSPKNDGFYYVKLDENHRSRWVHYHKLGTSVENDPLIFEETDASYFLGISLSEEDEFLFIDSHDHQSTEIHFMRADAPESSPQLIAARREDVEYDVSQYGSSFLIVTNAGDAEDFELVMAPISAPGPENWRPLLPHQRGRLLLGIDVTKQHLAWIERENALPHITIAPISERRAGEITLGKAHTITFEEKAYSLGMSSGYEFDTNELRFTYSSPTTPSQVWAYNMNTRERTLLKTQEVPSGHNPDDYITQRVFATAADGAEVPITLLYHADTPLDGSAPTLLYGYGSYGMSMPASFGTRRLSLVDRGFIYAIAHVRGGMDKGYHWYSQGRRNNKKNTFTDFITCAEHLVKLGLTQRGRIIGEGGSAGGMLVGAMANMDEGLFLGLIADVPFVDVLNTICDETLPLTPPEWKEWGNPILDPDACSYIRSYSPYDNVHGKHYPHILVTAGLSDPRVTYWEPAKWVAKLRKLNKSNNLLMLKTHMEAGHGGASGRFDSLKDDALAFAFALMICDEQA